MVPDAAVEDGGSDVLEGGGRALVPRAPLDEEAVRDVGGVVDAQPDGDDEVVARHLINYNQFVNTLQTAYNAVICPRGNLPYKQIYLTKGLKLLKN